MPNLTTRPAWSDSLPLQRIATLDVAAASGIAERAGKLYVVADDELELVEYSLAGTRSASIALAPGVLPESHSERKASKPDFEALLTLPDGSLLALGSGSSARRMRGAWITFDDGQAVAQAVELADLYSALLSEYPELNIEGAAVLGAELILCSRGNGARRDNALIMLDLASALADLAACGALRASSFRHTQRVALGELAGTPLSLTDLAPLGDQLLFSAAAEASANTYDDGACAGSIVGCVNRRGEVSRGFVVTPQLKIEGICVAAAAPAPRLFLVADADDRAARAPLMAAEWPGA